MLMSLISFISLFLGDSYSDSLRIKAEKLKINKITNTAYRIGEELNFEISYKMLFSIPAGYTKMEVRDTVFIRNRPCYHIVVTTRSTKFIETFYSVKDTIESFIDMEYGMSMRFIKKTREGSYFADSFVEYDQLRQKAYVKNVRYNDSGATKINNVSEFVMDILPFSQDLMSSFYFMRTSEIAVGNRLKINNHSSDKSYMLKVQIVEKDDEDVGAGDFDVFYLLPKIEGENIINSDKQMHIWISDDKYRLPIRMKTSIAIGSVNVELESYKLGK